VSEAGEGEESEEQTPAQIAGSSHRDSLKLETLLLAATYRMIKEAPIE
jgi:hypothetical protein